MLSKKPTSSSTVRAAILAVAQVMLAGCPDDQGANFQDFKADVQASRDRWGETTAKWGREHGATKDERADAVRELRKLNVGQYVPEDREAIEKALDRMEKDID
jgi:Ni/Co efflux regulator RcnB